MAKKDKTNEVEEEEKKAEVQAEVAEKVAPIEEPAVNADEAAEETEAVEEAAQAEEATPAEVEAVNVDNETAKEATKRSAPSGKYAELIKTIEGLTTVELAELVKDLEERFGVSAAAPVAIAGAPATGGVATPEEEEKTNYTVVLADAGAQKIAVIKALREINQELGLKEAKDLADGAPKEIKKDVPKAEAEEAKKKLEAAGAKVELK